MEAFYSRDSYGKRHATVLHDFPKVAAHYKKLVPEKVYEEEFWQRHDYRCDEERVLRQWERRPAEGQRNRAKALAKKSMVQNAFDASVSAVKSSAEKLAASLQEASKDVETWNELDAKNEAQKEEKNEKDKGVSTTVAKNDDDDKSFKTTTKSSKTTSWSSWLFGSNTNSSNLSDNTGETSRATKSETLSSSNKKSLENSSSSNVGNKNAKKPLRPTNSRAEGLRQASDGKNTASSSTTGLGGRKVSGNTTTCHTNHGTNENKPSAIDEKGENKEQTSSTTSWLQAVKGYPQVSPGMTILIAIVFGFLANAMFQYVLWSPDSIVVGWCSRPSVDAPSRFNYLICGDQVNAAGAVEVFDQRNQRDSKHNSRRGTNNQWENNIHDDPGMLDSSDYDNSDGMIGNLINSWMQNVDFSQFTNAAAAGAEQQQTWEQNDSTGLFSNRRRRRDSDGAKEEKRGGVFGFFKRRFRKRKSTDVVAPTKQQLSCGTK